MTFHRHLRTVLSPLLFALVLAGCAATVKKGGSAADAVMIPPASASRLVLNVGGSERSLTASDWLGFKAEWSENFAEQAGEAGIAFEMQDGPPKPTGVDGTLLTVFVDDYRFLRPGTRYVVGIMSGNAYIQSKLSFNDLRTGALLAENTADTTSSAWQGVFSPMTNKQVAAIAADVIGQMKAARSGAGQSAGAAMPAASVSK